MNPIRLIQLRCVSVGIFGVEMLMSGGQIGLVDVGRFNIIGLARKWISGGLDVVNVPVGLLFLS